MKRRVKVDGSSLEVAHGGILALERYNVKPPTDRVNLTAGAVRLSQVEGQPAPAAGYAERRAELIGA
jgi:hypothetical protein